MTQARFLNDDEFDVLFRNTEFISVRFEGDEGLDVEFGDEQFDASFGEITILKSGTEEYAGATTVTPSSVVQVLSTRDKVVNENIVINPIPNNYGLITYNGSTITVS